MHFSDRLFEQISIKNSALVVGLDPVVENFPAFLQPASDAFHDICESIYQFNKLVIDALCDQVAIVKPQLAYYEIYGSQGIYALEKTIAYAKAKNLLVINDAKRNDIGTSANAYAKAFLRKGNPMCADAVTVNPFLGSDGVIPFINEAQKNGNGIFVLLKTSNPSSHELQDLILESGRSTSWTLAEKIAELSEGTLGRQYSLIGAVVGATYPDTAKKLRQQLPSTVFLVPGLGAQGGTVEDVKDYFDLNGNGALISSSRAILYSYMEYANWYELSEEEVTRCIRDYVRKVNVELNQVRFR